MESFIDEFLLINS